MTGRISTPPSRGAPPSIRQTAIGVTELVVGGLTFIMGVKAILEIPEIVAASFAAAPFTGGGSLIAGLGIGAAATFDAILLVSVGALIFVDGVNRLTGERTVMEKAFGVDPFADPVSSRSRGAR